MKAAQLLKYGGQDSVQVKNAVTQPIPLVGEILVEVYAAAVNPFDWKLREGAYKEYINLDLPATLGGDVAGVIAAVGEDVEGVEVGQEVFGQANAVSGKGSLAEFTIVKADHIAPKPANIDFVYSAALPLAATSAYQALVDHMGLQAGQQVLIHGGAGGIGSFAIQIAKTIGAHVTTTVSAADADFVKSLGADVVIDYETQNFAELVKDLDAVFDNVGGETNTNSYQVIKPGGHLVSMLVPPNDELVNQYQVIYTQQNSQATSERLIAVAEMASTGQLKINVDKVFSLDQAPEALEYLKTGHPKGKVVVQVKEA
ncbi:MAG TPA: NADP-dependent oxidoreductase [Candidatus Saccharimonadales bacterium]|nr:NADP-dependent oxidoreductase [Candidatus Saccharimonadales bacterium]